MLDKANREALLLIDCQSEVLAAQVADVSSFLERIATAARAARDHGVPVIYVQVKFRRGYPEVAAANRRFRAVAEAGRLQDGGLGAAIPDAIEPDDGDLIVTKRRTGAFSGSDLLVLLRAMQVETLVLAGVGTSGAILSTARAAADLDYELRVLRDGTSDESPEVHEFLLDHVLSKQADVLTIGSWAASLAAHRPTSSRTA